MHHETRISHLNPIDCLPSNPRQYIERYRDTLNEPLNIVNHIGILSYPSVEATVEERITEMSSFMLDPTNEDNRWGRTIFAEPISRDLIETAFKPVFERNKLEVLLTPTSMDPSIHESDFYQKGSDLCIAKNEGGIYKPLCGIDITLGDSHVVRAKRNRPGFQGFACMPVIVLPMNNLTYDQGDKKFAHYLNTHALKAVQRGVPNDNFYGLTKAEILTWKQQLGDNFSTALSLCRTGLKKNNYSVQSFPYKSELFSLLDTMDNLMANYSQHVKRLH